MYPLALYRNKYKNNSQLIKKKDKNRRMTPRRVYGFCVFRSKILNYKEGDRNKTELG